MSNTKFSASEEIFLHEAASYFQDPGSFIRGMNFLGSQLEKAEKLLPNRAQKAVTKAVSVSLNKALSMTLTTLDKAPKNSSLDHAFANSEWKGHAHSLATSLTGGLGGFFGMQAIVVELPISTMLMMRSIAETAREFGEDLSTPEGALECLLVFALGGPGNQDDMSETAYYGVRLSMAASVREAAQFVANMQAKQIADAIRTGSAPALVKLVTRIAAAFEIRVTKKMLAQLAPVAGSVGGAAVNAVFTEFYSKAARYHFGIRKLERKYGAKVVQVRFQQLSSHISASTRRP